LTIKLEKGTEDHGTTTRFRLVDLNSDSKMDLLALGIAIRALSDKSAFSSFRESKLNMLLKDPLGGNPHTLVLRSGKQAWLENI
jgi:hypothetical protein